MVFFELLCDGIFKLLGRLYGAAVTPIFELLERLFEATVMYYFRAVGVVLWSCWDSFSEPL